MRVDNILFVITVFVSVAHLPEVKARSTHRDTEDLHIGKFIDSVIICIAENWILDKSYRVQS